MVFFRDKIWSKDIKVHQFFQFSFEEHARGNSLAYVCNYNISISKQNLINYPIITIKNSALYIKLSTHIKLHKVKS